MPTTCSFPFMSLLLSTLRDYLDLTNFSDRLHPRSQLTGSRCFVCQRPPTSFCRPCCTPRECCHCAGSYSAASRARAFPFYRTRRFSRRPCRRETTLGRDRKSTRLNSSHLGISYAVFCLKKKKKNNIRSQNNLLMVK